MAETQPGGSTNEGIFQQLGATLESGGVDALLQQLDDYFVREKRYHELFEIAKLSVRRQLELPLIVSSTESLPPAVRDALEDGLIAACRRIGMLLLRDGRLRDSWQYLRAVGDRDAVADELVSLEPTSENLDEFIELLIHEDLGLERGFQLMLDHYGLCNTITTFDSSMYGQPRARRAVGARLLVQHIHRELRENLSAHIEREEGAAPADAPMTQWIANRPWLFADGAYHLDTTHLASVVGFARELDSADDLELAVDLAEYGKRLHANLQYAGEPPFQPLYEVSLSYFHALLGRDVDRHVEQFRKAAEAIEPREDTTMVIEVYVDLLHRLGASEQALSEAIRLLPEDVQQTGRAPSLMEMASASGQFDSVKEVARRRSDALGFAMALLMEKSQST